MVSGTKFFIYGGGRWREVDLNDGRIEGWGRAKFVYPRRGKVHVAKTRAVLTALRDLSAGQNSAVKDGAHLPHKKSEIIKKNERNESICKYSQCCLNLNSNNNGCVPSKIKQTPKTDTGIQCIPKADAGIQTSLPSQTLSFSDSINKRKRPRETTSSDENAPTKITTMAMVHTKNSSSRPRIVLSKKSSTADRSKENIKVPKKKIPSLKLNKADASNYNIYQRKRSDSTDSIVWVVLPKNMDNKEKLNSNKVTEYLKTDSNKTSTKKQSDNTRFHSRPKLQSQSNINSSKEQKNRKSRSNYEKQKTTRRSESSSDTTSYPQTKSAAIDAREDQCKELIIDEKDVEILRNYLVLHASDFNLLKFDQDDEYKKHFFFKINPLVNVERCPKITSMLQSESQDDFNLKEFAFQLGLKSITELSVPRRYRMRKLKETRRYLDRDRSESEMDKENSEKFLRNKDRKGNDKLIKYKKIRSMSSSSYSSESDTSTGNLEEYKNNDKGGKKSERLLNKSLMESNKTSRSTRYEIRKSKNSQRRELKELFSSEGYDKMRNSGDDSNDSEVPETSKEVYRKTQIKVNNRSNFNLYLPSNDDSDVDTIEPSNETNKKGQNKIDLTTSNDENSDKEVPKSSKEIDKTSQNKRKNNKRNISLTKENKIDVDDAKSSKESNRRVQEKANVSKFNANNMKIHDLTGSNEEISDAEIPKPSKHLNQKTRVNKKNNVDHKASNEESSDEEINKSSKEPNRRVQNKRNNKNNENKRRNTEYKNSDDDTHKSSKELSRSGQNKVNSNKIKKNRINNINDKDSNADKSEKELPKSLKEINRRVQNEGNDKNNKNKGRNTDDESSDDDTHKSSKELSRSGRNKVNSNRIHKNKINNINDKDSNADKSEKELPKPFKETNKRVQNKGNDKNNKNKGRNTDDESSDDDTHKSSKELSRSGRNKVNSNRINKNKINNINDKDSNADKSEKELPKPLKETNRRVQNKGNDKNNKNKGRNTDDASSDDDTHKSSKELSRSGRNKVNSNRINKNKINNINDKDSNADESEKEVPKSLKETNGRVQNKGNDKNNKNKEKNTDDESSDDDTHKSSKELDRRGQNKANYKTNSRIKKHNEENSEVPKLRSNINDQSEANTTKNTTTDNLELSSDNERRFFVKKNGGFVETAVKEGNSTLVGSKRTNSRQLSSGTREYSNLEDHAIVTWVSVGGRASCVNGNRIWKELQDQYEKIAGQTRSWHSLRNRYLRNILPKLGQYALPHSQEARLRAAAATGEIKSRKRAPRRNSIFALPSRGALSRRPGTSRSLSSEPEPPAKRHKHDHTRRDTSPSPKRALRSSLAPSPEKSRPSLRYSDITRHFADKHRRNNSTPSASPKSATKESRETNKSPVKHSVTEERRESSAKRTLSKDSSETKSLRRSFRTNVLPQETEKSPDKDRSRTRRLFNPSSML